MDFFKAKIFYFLQNEIFDLTDYEDEEILIDDEKVADSNSNKKKENFPSILTIAYEFDDIKVLEKGNKFKCKACDNNIPVSSVKSGNRKSKNQLKRLNLFS